MIQARALARSMITTLHEPLTWRELVAGACILGAIALVLGSPAARRAGDR